MFNKNQFILKVINKLKTDDCLILPIKDLSRETLGCIHETFQYDYIYDPVNKVRMKITDVKERI
jgi:hypothetical protein